MSNSSRISLILSGWVKLSFLGTGVDKRERLDKKQKKKKDIGERVSSQKAMSLAQIHLCTFFCLSFLVSHEALTVLQRTIRNTYPRAYQCIWDNYIIL